jgi:hypothetical protein
MARNAHIRPEHVENICLLIHRWTDPRFSWAEVCKACKPILGYVPSRSGLSSHGRIQIAFRSRKKSLKDHPSEHRSLPNSRAAAARAISARDAEIAALKLQVKELMAQFVRWQYNASLHHVTPEMLDDRSQEVVIDRINVAGRNGKDRH